MVSQIEFQSVDDLSWPQMRSAKLVNQGESDDMNFTEYSLTNTRITDVQFHVTIGHFFGADEFKRFLIRRADRK